MTKKCDHDWVDSPEALKEMRFDLDTFYWPVVCEKCGEARYYWYALQGMVNENNEEVED